jgi:hypothetical protein
VPIAQIEFKGERLDRTSAQAWRKHAQSERLA